MSSIQYLDIVRRLKRERFPDVEEELTLAIIETESSFDPLAFRGERPWEPGLAVYNTASFGLMQILPETAAQMGFKGDPDELLDPETNIAYGMAYLSWLKTQFPGNQEAVIMSYNEGPGNYRKGERVWGYYTKVSARAAKWAALLAAEG